MRHLHKAAVTAIALGSLVGTVQSVDAGGLCPCPAAGTVLTQSKISSTTGAFNGQLDNTDLFGNAVASIGDLDGDGVGDLAVGAPLDDDGGPDRGAVWLLFLNANGAVKSKQKISSNTGGFAGPLHNSDAFGSSVASLGDIDGDGIVDLAVGAMNDDDGGTDRGAVWVLRLNVNGTVKSQQKTSSIAGNFAGQLDNGDGFGVSVASPGDLNGDGIPDLAVGSSFDDDGGPNRGAVWILFLHTNGTVNGLQKISAATGGFTGQLDNLDLFGSSVASLGDIDGDGISDLAVGAMNDDDGGTDRGAVWILLMNVDGTVKDQKKISGSSGGFGGQLDNADALGFSVTRLGDLNGDGIADLAVGANRDDDGGTDRGAVWIVTLVGCLPTPAPVGDFNNDCSVDGADLAILLGAWTGPAGDLNNDGTTDGADLAILLGAWTG